MVHRLTPSYIQVLRELHDQCAPSDDGADVDSSKGTTQLEVYALEIQMYGELKNNKKLRVRPSIASSPERWRVTRMLTISRFKTGNLRKVVASPVRDPASSDSGRHSRVRRQDVHVRECVHNTPRFGGHAVLRLTPQAVFHVTSCSRTEDWTKAQVDFFEAFKAYDEAGSPQRIQVLKYLVLAHMLTESEIDPFDSQETKPYKSDREIAAMQALVQAYQDRNVHEAEKILRSELSLFPRTTPSPRD